jgi:hypothetical protein
MSYNDTLVTKAKDWFGDGEVDVDLMIGCGALTLDRIISMYLSENNLKLEDFE